MGSIYLRGLYKMSLFSSSLQNSHSCTALFFSDKFFRKVVSLYVKQTTFFTWQCSQGFFPLLLDFLQLFASPPNFRCQCLLSLAPINQKYTCMHQHLLLVNELLLIFMHWCLVGLLSLFFHPPL